MNESRRQIQSLTCEVDGLRGTVRTRLRSPAPGVEDEGCVPSTEPLFTHLPRTRRCSDSCGSWRSSLPWRPAGTRRAPRGLRRSCGSSRRRWRDTCESTRSFSTSRWPWTSRSPPTGSCWRARRAGEGSVGRGRDGWGWKRGRWKARVPPNPGRVADYRFRSQDFRANPFLCILEYKDDW